MTWRPHICVYHANCSDGFGAAWAVWRKWGDSVEYVPAFYGKPLTFDPTGKNVLFVDFSLKREAMEQFPAAITVVLDHHKTAKDELAQWCVPMPKLDDIADRAEWAAWITGRPVVAVFDMERSGAALAWEFCHSADVDRPCELPALIKHIEDRDLWRQPPRYTLTPEVAAALRSYPQDFHLWDRLAADVSELAREGVVILRSHLKNVAAMCDQAYMGIIGNHEVPVVNVPYLYASDCAHELLNRYPHAPFAATWLRRGDGVRQFSLRSEYSRVDVSVIARAMGGGGHRNAAGFEVSQDKIAAGVGEPPARNRGEKALRWAVDMFGPVATHFDERALRLVEEAIELAQAEDVSKDVMLRVVDRVYARPPGDVAAEVGAVALTLDLLAQNRGLDVAAAAEKELRRVLSKTREHFHTRHAAKAALGIANLRQELPKAGAFSNG